MQNTVNPSDSPSPPRRRTRRSSGTWPSLQPSITQSPTIDVETLQDHFHLPITDVAKKLGVCATVLKKICRKNGISRWPHRKIKSLDKTIANLEAARVKNPQQQSKINEELEAARQQKEALVRNPNGNAPSKSMKSRRRERMSHRNHVMEQAMSGSDESSIGSESGDTSLSDSHHHSMPYHHYGQNQIHGYHATRHSRNSQSRGSISHQSSSSRPSTRASRSSTSSAGNSRASFDEGVMSSANALNAFSVSENTPNRTRTRSASVSHGGVPSAHTRSQADRSGILPSHALSTHSSGHGTMHGSSAHPSVRHSHAQHVHQSLTPRQTSFGMMPSAPSSGRAFSLSAVPTTAPTPSNTPTQRVPRVSDLRSLYSTPSVAPFGNENDREERSVGRHSHSGMTIGSHNSGNSNTMGISQRNMSLHSQSQHMGPLQMPITIPAFATPNSALMAASNQYPHHFQQQYPNQQGMSMSAHMHPSQQGMMHGMPLFNVPYYAWNHTGNATAQGPPSGTQPENRSDSGKEGGSSRNSLSHPGVSGPSNGSSASSPRNTVSQAADGAPDSMTVNKVEENGASNPASMPLYLRAQQNSQQPNQQTPQHMMVNPMQMAGQFQGVQWNSMAMNQHPMSMDQIMAIRSGAFGSIPMHHPAFVEAFGAKGPQSFAPGGGILPNPGFFIMPPNNGFQFANPYGISMGQDAERHLSTTGSASCVDLMKLAATATGDVAPSDGSNTPQSVTYSTIKLETSLKDDVPLMAVGKMEVDQLETISLPPTTVPSLGQASLALPGAPMALKANGSVSVRVDAMEVEEEPLTINLDIKALNESLKLDGESIQKEEQDDTKNEGTMEVDQKEGAGGEEPAPIPAQKASDSSSSTAAPALSAQAPIDSSLVDLPAVMTPS